MFLIFVECKINDQFLAYYVAIHICDRSPVISFMKDDNHECTVLDRIL